MNADALLLCQLTMRTDKRNARFISKQCIVILWGFQVDFVEMRVY